MMMSPHGALFSHPWIYNVPLGAAATMLSDLTVSHINNVVLHACMFILISFSVSFENVSAAIMNIDY